KEALARLNGVSSNNRNVEFEISRIQNAIESTPSSSSKVIFRSSSDCRLGYRFMLCIVIQTLQQLGNIPEIVATSSLAWKFLCFFVTFAVVDRLGRRSLFVVSGSGMCLCMVVMAVTSSLSASNQISSIVSAVTIFVFNFFFPIGFLGGNFLYCAEVAPICLRVAMSSIYTANHWL
ncbi:sugar transporter, partial [Penicillium manginii]|uniref:sugar transporter n=1 Tax=Penicillium manginii TaxID=203109 RepID=UPI0025494736